MDYTLVTLKGKFINYMVIFFVVHSCRFKKLQVEMFLSKCQMYGLILHMFTLLKAILHLQ